MTTEQEIFEKYNWITVDESGGNPEKTLDFRKAIHEAYEARPKCIVHKQELNKCSKCMENALVQMESDTADNVKAQTAQVLLNAFAMFKARTFGNYSDKLISEKIQAFIDEQEKKYRVE